MRKTIFDSWTTDLRKILFCIVILLLGTFLNIKEPKALAIAVIVQGASNIDGFWEYLNNKYTDIVLKIMIIALVVLSTLAATVSVMSLTVSSGYYDRNTYKYASLLILFVIVSCIFPIVPLVTDFCFNIKEDTTGIVKNMEGGEDNEL